MGRETNVQLNPSVNLKIRHLNICLHDKLISGKTHVRSLEADHISLHTVQWRTCILFVSCFACSKTIENWGQHKLMHTWLLESGASHTRQLEKNVAQPRPAWIKIIRWPGEHLSRELKVVSWRTPAAEAGTRPTCRSASSFWRRSWSAPVTTGPRKKNQPNHKKRPVRILFREEKSNGLEGERKEENG
jgi:hypothetical protein